MRNLVAGFRGIILRDAHQMVHHALEDAHRIIRLVEVSEDKACLVAVHVELLHVLDVAVDDGDVALEELLRRQVIHSIRVDDVRTTVDGPTSVANRTGRIVLAVVDVLVRSTIQPKESARSGPSIWLKAGRANDAA